MMADEPFLEDAVAGEAVRKRFSCRAYDLSRTLASDELEQLRDEVGVANAHAGLHFQLVGPLAENEAPALSDSLFRNAPSCYLALVATDSPRMEELVGYYGERFVLLATSLGLGTCWVMGSYEKDSVHPELGDGEKLHGIIPVGYPMRVQPLRQRAVRHSFRKNNRYLGDLYDGPTKLRQAPLWIQAGVGSIWAGPSAVNEQPVVIRQAIKDAPVSASLDREHLKTDHGLTDLGIAKLHFEIGAASEDMQGSWQWGDGGSFLPA